MARHIFVGDVHGCIEELDELIAQLGLASDDRLYFVGDLVDRGPDSPGVIARVAELVARFPGSVAVAGNHEEKALRQRDRGADLPPWAPQASDAHWAFLDAMPLLHRVPELGAIVLHGGMYPRFFEKHGTIGDVPKAWRRATGKRAERVRRFLRVRRVSADGGSLGLGVADSGARHWSAVYDGREGFCFFGHDPQITPAVPLRAAHATGIDTACCFGGALTAAIVADGEDPRAAAFVTVPARAKYSEPLNISEMMADA